jgi:hypothetical protein
MIFIPTKNGVRLGGNPVIETQFQEINLPQDIQSSNFVAFRMRVACFFEI